MDIIGMLLDVDNEKTLADISSLIHSARKGSFEPIAGVPGTVDEFLADANAAEEDYLAGRTITSSELRNRMEAW